VVTPSAILAHAVVQGSGLHNRLPTSLAITPECNPEVIHYRSGLKEK
jgi:hypothetical protein